MEQEPTLPTEEAPATEEQREKRKRATAAIDFDKLSNGEAEDPTPAGDLPGEPPSKKARTYSGLEHVPDYDLLQARQMLHVLSDSFPEVAKRVMKDKVPDDYEDEGEANTAIKDIRYLQGIKSGTNINMWLGGIGLSTIEDIAVGFTPLKLQGLSNLSHDPEFQELWKEVSIDFMTLRYLDPKARLGLYLVKSAYILHHMNSGLENGRKSNAPVIANIEKPVQEE